MRDKLIELIIDGFRNCTKPHFVTISSERVLWLRRKIDGSGSLYTDNQR